MSKDELLTIKIALLEQNHRNLMEKIEEILIRFDKFEEKLNCALAKKADIWVEKALSWTAYTVVGAVLLALIYLVVNK
jgi:hypothetical protein